MGKKILVTGGAGYIGSHVIVELAETCYEPVIVDNFVNSGKEVLEGLRKILGREVKSYEVDCCDLDDLRKVFDDEGDIEGVIHFAAHKAVGESVKKPLDYYHNNILSLINLIKVMKEFNVRSFVFSSSCTVYGVPDKLPIKEDALVKKANSPYGETKQICERIISDCLKSGDLDRVVLLRYFNPIGAHGSSLIGELPLGEPANLVPIMTQIAAGFRKELIVYGDDYDTIDGTCIRDYLHVMDLADAHVKAIEFLFDFKGLEVFNLGSGEGKSVMEMIKAFEKVSLKKLNYRIGGRREGDVPVVWADATKAREILGWRAERSVEDALESAWKWQRRLKRFRREWGREFEM